MVTSQLKNSNYSLSVGEAGRARLEVLNAIHNPYTLGALSSLSLPKGANVLELGCGTGLLSAELAKWVGPEVSVLAVDISEEQLELARGHAKEHELSHLRFQRLAAEDVGGLNEDFDLVVIRFLLCHLKHPEAVLEGCEKVLKQGGYLYVEELSGIDSMVCFPPSDSFDQFLRMVEQQITYSGTDFEIGIKLWAYLQPFPFDLIQYQLHQPLLKTAYERGALTLGAMEGGGRLVEAGLWDEPELQPLITGLKELENDPVRMPSYGRSAQILLRKK